MPDTILGILRDILNVNQVNKDPCPGGVYILVRGGGEIRCNKRAIYVAYGKKGGHWQDEGAWNEVQFRTSLKCL